MLCFLHTLVPFLLSKFYNNRFNATFFLNKQRKRQNEDMIRQLQSSTFRNEATFVEAFLEAKLTSMLFTL